MTVERKTSYSTHTGKVQITGGQKSVFVSALVVPSFKDDLISVGRLTKISNVLFAEMGVFLVAKQELGTSAKHIGGNGSDKLYALLSGGITGISSLRATPATLNIPANEKLHKIMIQTNPKSVHELKRQYPNADAYTLNTLGKQKEEVSKSCERRVLGKAKR